MPSSEVMHKFKHGQLHSGSKSGKKVTNPAQAKAILMSEKRVEGAHGGKYPDKKKKKKGHAKADMMMRKIQESK